jgi:hypothetical protein
MTGAKPTPPDDLRMSGEAFDRIMHKALQVKPEKGRPKTKRRVTAKLPREKENGARYQSWIRNIRSGCRHSTPDFCKNHSTEGKCAFVREDRICRLPRRSWKQIFKKSKAKAPL